MAIPGVKLIDEILAGLPENARLRTQLNELREQIATLQEENTRLVEKIESLEKEHAIDAEVLKTLKMFFDAGNELSAGFVAKSTGEKRSVVEYHFDVLRGMSFIRQTRALMSSDVGIYSITPEGRAFIIKNGMA